MTRTGFQKVLLLRSPDQRKTDTWTELFRAVSEVCPEVIEDLKARVFPLYRRLNWAGLGGADYDNLEGWAEAIRSDLLHTDCDGAILELYDKLMAWGKRWWLHHREAYEQAFWAFRAWEHAPEPEDDWPLLGRGDFFRVLNAAFRLEVSEWNPHLESESEFRLRVEAEYREALERYISFVRQRAEAEGLREEARRPNLGEHMVWLVLRQCKGWGYAQIRDFLDLEAGRSAVRDAQEALARELGLALRPTPRGRPKE
ncbi:hypothetical protein Mterra_02109 [Calidithermus terrae]|uniref:Uncharacterized protein n=1 Tax=Calidithermus terrae TaxID=1408545 RepID=A0A399ENE9_9DEIN|nr:hypothetical protein Mterra_02109 [Calidithermus terrae]